MNRTWVWMYTKLFSKVGAARAAAYLNSSREWSQVDVVDLILRLQNIAPLTTLAESGARLVKSLALRLVTDPVTREVCWDAGLKSIMNEQEQLELMSRTGEYELAAAMLADHTRTKDQEFYSRLQLSVQTGKILPHKKLDSKQWALLFDLALRNDNLNLATMLWENKAHLRDVPITASMYSKFVTLCGINNDRVLLLNLKNFGSVEARADSAVVASVLQCFTNWKELMWTLNENLDWLENILILQDARGVSDILARNVTETIDRYKTPCEEVMPTLIGNLLLQGLYRNNTSQTVLHVYRTLRLECGFEANEKTASILANTAYRLGNSKTLMYDIYQELKPTSRHFYETWIACQLVGSAYNSVLFVLAEMARRGITLRSHIQRLIFFKFDRLGNVEPLLELTKPSFVGKYLEFDYKLALNESKQPAQAQANAEHFTDGFRPQRDRREVLIEMLTYDERRSQRQNEWQKQIV